MLRSAYLAPPLSGGGVRLFLIYPGSYLKGPIRKLRTAETVEQS